MKIHSGIQTTVNHPAPPANRIFSAENVACNTVYIELSHAFTVVLNWAPAGCSERTVSTLKKRSKKEKLKNLFNINFLRYITRTI